MPDVGWRADLYRGTALDYERWRPGYPVALLDDLRRRLPVSGGGRLLDLGCGTGQIAVPLAADFVEVVAVDQESESLAVGAEKALASNIRNIAWLAGSAETVTLDGSFELIGIGNAFHRLDRPVVAERARSWLQPAGGVALVWTDYWRGDLPWQQAMENLVIDWTAELGAADRIPSGWAAEMERLTHEQVLTAAGFRYVGRFEFPTHLTWTIESLAGFMRSGSVLNGRVVGNRAAEFERDLADRLRPYLANGVFEQTASFAYELAINP